MSQHMPPAGIIACVVGIRSLMYFGFAVDHSYLYNAFETRFDSIAVGCLVAIVSNQRRFVMLAAVLSKSALESCNHTAIALLFTYMGVNRLSLFSWVLPLTHCFWLCSWFNF